MELMSVQAVTFLVGLTMIVVGIFGGGIEVKEIKIPTLPVPSRAMSLVAGTVLVVVCLAFPQIFARPSASPPALSGKLPPGATAEDKSKIFLGAAIQNRLVTVQDVKRILRHLGKYSGALNDDADELYFQAVGEFQVSQNVDVDGLVGPVTYARLREAWPDFFDTGKTARDTEAGKAITVPAEGAKDR